MTDHFPTAADRQDQVPLATLDSPPMTGDLPTVSADPQVPPVTADHSPVTDDDLPSANVDSQPVIADSPPMTDDLPSDRQSQVSNEHAGACRSTITSFAISRECGVRTNSITNSGRKHITQN